MQACTHTQALQECDLMSSLVELLSRAVERVDENVSLDTMEGVTYLLQRMQVGASHALLLPVLLLERDCIHRHDAHDGIVST